jgi:hypothetical protein
MMEDDEKVVGLRGWHSCVGGTVANDNGENDSDCEDERGWTVGAAEWAPKRKKKRFACSILSFLLIV